MEINIGKFYRTRGGEKIGPMRFNGTNPKVFPFKGDNSKGIVQSYTVTGAWNCDGTESVNDLIEEWRDEPDIGWCEADGFGEGVRGTNEKPGDDNAAVSLQEIEAASVQCYTHLLYGDSGNAAKPAVMGDPAYSSLAGILQAAHDQAASGKGRERHSDDKPFLEQPIMEIARMLGDTGGHAYQIMKKAQEAHRMVKRGQFEAAEREALGVINYAAAMILLIREIEFPPEGQE